VTKSDRGGGSGPWSAPHDDLGRLHNERSGAALFQGKNKRKDDRRSERASMDLCRRNSSLHVNRKPQDGCRHHGRDQKGQ
jgi:hypothetical protein